jgi:hypothetical protein
MKCRWEAESPDPLIGQRQFCPQCGVVLVIGPQKSVSITVTGEDHVEVQEVASRLAAEAADRAAVTLPRSPWVAGSFYLTCMVTMVALLLVVAEVLPVLALPVVLIAGVIALTIIGALQLRHDRRLTEKGFLELMGIVLSKLPLLIARTGREGGRGEEPSTSRETPPDS